jgi:hypothetical protein
MKYLPNKKRKSTFSRVPPGQPTWSVCLARLIFLITHAHQVRYSAHSGIKRISHPEFCMVVVEPIPRCCDACTVLA